MLKIENLQASYGKIQALRDISFELNEGEIMSIIGANGAGKSTLMKCIIGLQRPDGGSVIYRGRPMGKSTYKTVQNGIVLVPEGRWIFPALTVEENLKLGAYIVKSPDEGLKRSFRMFPKLEERKKQRAGTLSGGEQQMLAIARGLMANPKLIMLDEPSLGLAPLIINDIMNIIKEINQQGVTVLMVEQNAKKALGIAHQACVMEQGRIVKRGSAAQLAQDESVIAAYLGGNKGGTTDHG
ncbi:ABC transporter ATP-binding protein [Ruminococcaceae bacterium OttesenSCG-928-D13]|nr:ABC transporter ATP-binding protein [Ruminococcaceae bacterium OttesenSCG-928-D13]